MPTDPHHTGALDLATEAREALRVAMADSGYSRCASWATGYGIRLLNELDSLQAAKGERDELKRANDQLAGLGQKSYARAEAAEAALAAAREALEKITRVRVEGWENIWAGQNKCAKIARAALQPPTPTDQSELKR